MKKPWWEWKDLLVALRRRLRHDRSWYRKCERRLRIESLEIRKYLSTTTVNVQPFDVNAGVQAAISVTLSQPVSSPVTVNYTITPGTAQEPTDFVLEGSASGTVTFPESVTSESLLWVSTAPTATMLAEKSFTIALSNPTCSVSLGNNSSVSGMIFEPVAVSVCNAGTVTAGNTANFELILSQTTNSGVTVDYSVSPGSAAGVSALSSWTTIPANSSTWWITIPTRPANEPNNAYFCVDLTGATDTNGSVPIFSPMSASASIQNGEVVSVSNAAPIVAGQTASFQLTLSQLSGSSVTVDYSISFGSSVSGVSAISSVATIPAGSSTAWISVPTQAVNEPSGAYFCVDLTYACNSSGSVPIGSPSSATAWLQASDLVSISGPDLVLAGQSACFDLMLSQACTSPVSVYYQTESGTATAGVNYQAVPSGAYATIPAGGLSAWISVSTLNTGVYDPYDPYFYVDLTSVGGAAAVALSSQSTASVYIESPDLVSISGPGQVTAGQTASFELTLAQPCATSVTVDYNVSFSPSASGLSPVYSVATIPAGSSTAWITVPTPAVNEPPSAYFCVDLTGLSGPSSVELASSSLATASIANGYLVSVSGPGQVVAGYDANVELTLSEPCASPVTVYYDTSNGTALAGTDYTPCLAGPMPRFPPGARRPGFPSRPRIGRATNLTTRLSSST